MPRLSLRNKLLIGIILVLVPVFALHLEHVRLHYDQQRDALLDRQVAIAETGAALIDTVLDDAIDLGWAIANDPVATAFDPMAADPHLQDLGRHYPEYLNIEVFNLNGDSVGTSYAYAPGEPRVNVAGNPHFQQAIAAGKPTVFGVSQSERWPNRPVVVIAVPVLDDSRSVGVVHMVFDLGRLPGHFDGVRLSPNDGLAVMDSRGLVAFQSMRPDLPWEQRDLSHLPEIQLALSGQTVRTDRFRSPILGTERVLGSVRSANYGWVVAVSSPVARIASRVEEVVRADLIAIALVGLVALAGAWKLSDLLGTMTTRIEATKRRLEAVFGSMNDAVYVADAAGRLIDANPIGIAFAGLRDEDLGRPLAEFVDHLDFRHPNGERLKLEELPLARALRGETFTGYEVWFRSPSGEVRMASASGAPVRDERGWIVLGVSIFRDITDEWRRDRERTALTRVAERIAATLDVDEVLATAVVELVANFDVALARIWIWSEADQMLVLRASAGLSNRTAATGSRFGRLRLGQFMIGTVAATHQMLWTNQIQQESWVQDPAWVREHGIIAFAAFPLLAADRLLGVMALFSRRPFDQKDLAALTAVAGQIAVAIENARLFSEARRRSAELEEERRRREVFTSAIAHDLRNLMTPLFVTVQLLPRWDRLPEDRRQKLLGQAVSQAHRLSALVTDLLDVSRIEAGRFQVEQRPTDLIALTRRIAEEQQNTTTRHRVVVEAPDKLEGTWDPDRLSQVLTNLINNAIKYSPEGGNVRVSVGAEEHRVKVCVIDQGGGLAPEDIALLFRPFVRIERTRTVHGIGLGLFISQAIVEAHGGRIWAESPGAGQGSTFCFTLPR